MCAFGLKNDLWTMDTWRNIYLPFCKEAYVTEHNTDLRDKLELNYGMEGI